MSVDNQGRTAPRKLLFYGAVLGVVLIAGGVLWVGGVRGHNLWQFWFDTGTPMVDIALGMAGGAMFSMLMWQVGQHYQGLIEIRNRLVAILDLVNFRWGHNLVLALLAAIPEEVFFRGALQPELGLLLTAVIFGGLHALTTVYFVYATIAGLVLGGLMEWRGTLWMPIAMHFMIDFVSLQVLAHWARQNEKPVWKDGPLS